MDYYYPTMSGTGSDTISDDEYVDDDGLKTFNISDKIVAVKNNETFLIEISFRELLRYSDSWSFNRKIDENKTQELYETLCNNYDIPWTLHAVYDNAVTGYSKKILILDGQHRKNAINLYIDKYDSHMTCDRKVWIWIYKVEFSESKNSNIALSLFKKINNNRIFQDDELPNTMVIDVVKMVCENAVLKKGIKDNDANSKSHCPFIHRKELNSILNENMELIASKTPQEIVENMIKINHMISLKSYKDIYGLDKSQKTIISNERKLDKAEKYGFFLNLGKKSKYPITTWIKFIGNPSELS